MKHGIFFETWLEFRPEFQDLGQLGLDSVGNDPRLSFDFEISAISDCSRWVMI